MSRDGKKTGGRDFKKGDPWTLAVSKNNKGNQLPKDLKDARALHKQEFESIIYKYLDSSEESLKQLIENKSLPIKELIVIKLLIVSLELADDKRLDFLLNRTYGKVKEQVEVAQVKTFEELVDESLPPELREKKE